MKTNSPVASLKWCRFKYNWNTLQPNLYAPFLSARVSRLSENKLGAFFPQKLIYLETIPVKKLLNAAPICLLEFSEFFFFFLAFVCFIIKVYSSVACYFSFFMAQVSSQVVILVVVLFAIKIKELTVQKITLPSYVQVIVHICTTYI